MLKGRSSPSGCSIMLYIIHNENKPDEEYIDSVMSVDRPCDVRCRVVVVVFGVRDRSDRGQALRAAHGPAQGAPLSAGTDARHRPPAHQAPASHHRVRHSRYTLSTRRLFSKSIYLFLCH